MLLQSPVCISSLRTHRMLHFIPSKEASTGPHQFFADCVERKIEFKIIIRDNTCCN